VFRGGTNSGTTATVDALQICLPPDELDARTEPTINLPTREDARVNVADVAPEITVQLRGMELDDLVETVVHWNQL
jgi:hypothetical protein